MTSEILIVEDDEALCETIKLRLEHAGYQTRIAHDGKLGFKMIQESKPTLVITDIIMPEIEGLEFIKMIREAYSNLPIIAVSGGGRMKPDGYLRAALNFGASKLLTKPFTNEELLEAVQGLLSE